MLEFDQELARDLEVIKHQALLRRLSRVDSAQGTCLRMEGCELLSFASNDYLGLAADAALKEAARQAVQEYGAGSGASRLLCGSLAPHHTLEEALAAFKQTQAALSFGSGWAAALGAIGSLISRNDVLILDRLAHACLVDAARLTGAKLRVFAHNDLADLEALLQWAVARRADQGVESHARPMRILIVTESVFSMDGDVAPLVPMVELKDRYGAWLMVDEAHATGLYGPRRCGVIESLGLGGRIEVQMGTLGKAVGAAGGYIAGSRLLRDLLVNRARPFIFSTAPVPAAAAAAQIGLDLIQGERGARLTRLLWERVAQFEEAAGRIPLHRSSPGASPIVPVIVGDEQRALAAAAALRAEGIYVPAIRYPTVQRGKARLRVTLTAAHTAAEVERLASELTKVLG
ncbi:MAG: 8-amino-7-oxononanoate synthase [Verrucomicrobiota bacterium]